MHTPYVDDSEDKRVLENVETDLVGVTAYKIKFTFEVALKKCVPQREKGAILCTCIKLFMLRTILNDFKKGGLSNCLDFIFMCVPRLIKNA